MLHLIRNALRVKSPINHDPYVYHSRLEGFRLPQTCCSFIPILEQKCLQLRLYTDFATSRSSAFPASQEKVYAGHKDLETVVVFKAHIKLKPASTSFLNDSCVFAHNINHPPPSGLLAHPNRPSSHFVHPSLPHLRFHTCFQRRRPPSCVLGSSLIAAASQAS